MASTEHPYPQRYPRTSALALTLLGTAFATTSMAVQALTITPSHLYATTSPNNDTIHEYDATGQWLASLPISGGDLRGIAIGPGGLIYVVVDPELFSATPRVDVFDATGRVIRSYPFTGSVWSHTALGKIAFSQDSSNFYVASAQGVYKFAIDGIGGTPLTTQFAYDVDVLPSGQILTAEDGGIALRSASGQLISRIESISDPAGISGSTSFTLDQVDAIAYSPDDNLTYVSILPLGRQPSLFALNGLSNVLVKFENFNYGMDIALADNDRLVVGSRSAAPAMFTRNLEYLGQVSGTEAPFITAYRDHLFASGFD